MATFLELVNSICRRMNEVELTASNFTSAVGYYAQTRDAVNAALNEIYNEQFEWPFLRTKAQQVLVVGQTRYSLPADFKYLDIETFRVRANSALSSEGSYLRPISYDDFIQRFPEQESTAATQGAGLPLFVFSGISLEWGVSPKPDKAYTVDYEYVRQPSDLVLPSDSPPVPDAHRYVILQGAEYYTHLFRDNQESAARVKEDFRKGIKDMRKVLTNRNDNVRSTMILR